MRIAASRAFSHARSNNEKERYGEERERAQTGADIWVSTVRHETALP